MNLIPWRNKHEGRADGGAPVPAADRLRWEMDRMLERFFDPSSGFGSSLFGGGEPALDIRETDEEIRVSAEVPGVDPKDIEVDVRGDVLTFSGEKKEESEHEGDRFRHSERRYGSFRRAVRLPAPVDVENVQAEHRNGVLTVTMRKAESSRPKRIQVKQS